MGARTKITDARARAFAPAHGREALLWGSLVIGFGLRVRPGGRKTWIVHRRCSGSVLKRSLGSLDAVTADDARRMARALVVDGPGAAATTVQMLRAFGPVFLADCAQRWKPATRRSHAHNLQNLILPQLGTRRVDAIGARDVRSWFADLAVRRRHRRTVRWPCCRR